MVSFARFRGGLRRHLVLLVLAALVPMLLWAGGLTWWLSLQERQTMERSLSETAGALAISVDQELRLSMAALNAAALSRVLINGDVAAFEEVARSLVAQHPEWKNVVLLNSDGVQVLNTLRPYGAPLPLPTTPGYEEGVKAVDRVLRTGEPAVSNQFFSRVNQENVVLVVVPVRNAQGMVSFVLAATMRPERLTALLAAQTMPPDYFAAIDDDRGATIARLPADEMVAGAWVKEASSTQRRGIVSGRAVSGEKVTVSFDRPSVADWVIVLGVKRSPLYDNLRNSLAITAGFGALVLAGSLFLAFGMSRRILKPVEALTVAARPFIQDREAVATLFGITELDALHQALDVLTGELAKTQQRFMTFFSAAPIPLFVLDEEGRLIAVNRTWLTTLGYDEAEVLGCFPWEMQTEQSRAHALDVVRPEFLLSGSKDRVRAEYVTKSGEVRDALVSLRADRDGEGRIIRTIGAFLDVTEQRRAEQALGRAVEEAERANDSKTRFLAAASHDLRQPLQALSLYLGVLKTRLNGREDQVMEAVGQCVEALTGLLNDMLDVARLDAGVITPKFAEVPVSRLMERVVAAWRIQAEAKGLRLDVVDSNLMVHTDPALMDRVLSNLVANAVRYTERGRILVGCRHAGNGLVRIEVWDTGIGIPNDKLGEIFEEFRQLGNPERRRDRGTGLGLSIVQRIAGLLGHGLAVRSVLGRGSVFSITMPGVAACSLEAEQADEAPKDQRSILVVDDEVHVRSALELVLAEMGHRVRSVETMEEAVQSTRSERPELVIADFRLAGGQTGIDVIRAVRSSCGDQVPAVVLTGDTDPATIRSIVGEGLDLLHKPIRLEALRAFLKKVA